MTLYYDKKTDRYITASPRRWDDDGNPTHWNLYNFSDDWADKMVPAADFFERTEPAQGVEA